MEATWYDGVTRHWCLGRLLLERPHLKALTKKRLSLVRHFCEEQRISQNKAVAVFESFGDLRPSPDLVQVKEVMRHYQWFWLGLRQASVALICAVKRFCLPKHSRQVLLPRALSIQ